MNIKLCLWTFFCEAITFPLQLSHLWLYRSIFPPSKSRHRVCPGASLNLVCRWRPAAEGVTLGQVYFPCLAPCSSGWTANLISERLAFMSTKASWNPRNPVEVFLLSLWVFVSAATTTVKLLSPGSKSFLHITHRHLTMMSPLHARTRW